MPGGSTQPANKLSSRQAGAPHPRAQTPTHQSAGVPKTNNSAFASEKVGCCYEIPCDILSTTVCRVQIETTSRKNNFLVLFIKGSPPTLQKWSLDWFSNDRRSHLAIEMLLKKP